MAAFGDHTWFGHLSDTSAPASSAWIVLMGYWRYLRMVVNSFCFKVTRKRAFYLEGESQSEVESEKVVEREMRTRKKLLLLLSSVSYFTCIPPSYTPMNRLAWSKSARRSSHPGALESGTILMNSCHKPSKSRSELVASEALWSDT